MGLELNDEQKLEGIAYEYVAKKKRDGVVINTGDFKNIVKELRMLGYERRIAKSITARIMKIVNRPL